MSIQTTSHFQKLCLFLSKKHDLDLMITRLCYDWSDLGMDVRFQQPGNFATTNPGPLTLQRTEQAGQLIIPDKIFFSFHLFLLPSTAPLFLSVSILGCLINNTIPSSYKARKIQLEL